MLGEFDIIRTYFNQPGLGARPSDVIRLGIGDDCAVLAVPPGKELAVSMDTLVESVHFPANADAALVGYRSLAVNLSDLAAMGAEPVGFTLGLTTPAADATWLREFSTGLKDCAQRYQCPLLGGDTTRGPLTITIQVHGLVDAGKAIMRSGGAVGDRIYVTGSLGVAAFALRHLQSGDDQSPDKIALSEDAFYRPLPRLALGRAVAGIASAGIDISDGLLADLGHICSMSGTGALIRAEDLPLGTPLKKLPDHNAAVTLAATGGDDYELILTVAPSRAAELEQRARDCAVPLSCIGELTADKAVACLDASGNTVEFTNTGYRHF